MNIEDEYKKQSQQELEVFINNCKIGDKVYTYDTSDIAGIHVIEAKVVKKYPDYALLSNGRYCWCKRWTDLQGTN